MKDEAFKGTRILIVSPGSEISDHSLESFYQRAFAALGCNVRALPLLRGRLFDSISDRIRRRLGKMLPTGLSPDLLGIACRREAREFQPDITFVIRGERLRPEAIQELDRISQKGCYNIYPDHPFAIPGPGALRLQQSLKEYRAVLTFARALIPVFLQLGARACHWLPFAFDPLTHRPCPGVQEGISYFGAWGPVQEEWLGSLPPFGLRIYGGGWDRGTRPGSKLEDCWRPREGIGPNMAVEIGRSRLVINFIRAEHGCAHSMKTFELPACGAAVAVNRTFEQQLFFSDTECIYYDTEPELLDKVSFYLEDLDALRRIGDAANKAVQSHTYISRAADLLRFCFNDGVLNIEPRPK
jgi:hypothetical protein